MPIYEYQCTACGHSLESFQKMSDAPLTQCPLCHQSTLEKLMSSAGFQLKGTGWYATDFKNKGKPEAPKETPPAVAKKTDDKSSSSSSTTGGTTE